MHGDNETRQQLLIERENLRQQVTLLQAREAELEKKLHHHTSEINALLGVYPQPVVARFDHALRHTYINTAVKLATGIAPENYLGKTSREMGMADPILSLWENTLRAVFDNAKDETVEYSLNVAGRNWVFQSYIVPEINSSGGVDSVLAVTRDISQQRQAEQALSEHMEIIETVNHLGQVLSAELDLQKLVQDITDAATELSGAEFGSFFYNLLDEQGESYTLYTLSGVPREHFSSFPMPRNTQVFGPTFHGEGTVRSANIRSDPRYGNNAPYHGMPEGHLPVTSYLAVSVISRSREVLGGLFFGHSKEGVFTERHERIIEGLAAQAAIAMDNARLYGEARNQQQQLQTTLASIGDAVIATDAGGRIQFMNSVAQALTAWNDRDAIDKPLEDVFRIVSEVTRETVESPVTKVIREGKIVGLANHTVLLARDGREIPIDDSGAPIRNSDGGLSGVILVFRDISERRASEQRINLLLELSAAFSQALTSNQIAEIVVEQGLKALGAVVGSVCLLVENGTMLELLNVHGLSQEIIEKYRRTPLEFPGPLNDAVRADSIVWLESFDEYVTDYPHFAEAIKRNGSRSTVCIPLKVDEKIIGGISLSFPMDKLRNGIEEGFFTALAQQCAQSLERARLYEAEQKARDLAEALRDTVVALSSTLDLSEVFDQILKNIDRVVHHDLADIMLIDEGYAGVVRSHRYAQYGLVKSEDEMQEFGFKLADNYYFQWVAEHKRFTIIQDTQTDKNWVKAHEPELIRSSICVPILIEDKIVGFLNINSMTPGFYRPEDGNHLQVFADQAAVAIRNAQLYQQAQEVAAMEERQRIARDLHDAVSQTLFSANIIAETLPQIWVDRPHKVLDSIKQLHQLTRGAAAEMRTLLMELRPSMLNNSRLSDLLFQLCDAFRGRTMISIVAQINLADEQEPPVEVRSAIYRIVQESFNNIVKHSHATHATLDVQRSGTTMQIRIADDGQGFDQSTLSSGLGFHSMRERAEKIGASFQVISTEGKGTEIIIRWTEPDTLPQ